jgi:transcriptional regulator with XRE-family HTH domain
MTGEELRMIGDLVRARRIARNWTQSELAERLGWSQASVSAVERGWTRVTPERLGQLIQALDLAPDDYIGLDPGGRDGQ